MKIDIAVYTAQEGYSWQPGTPIPIDDIAEYKSVIGRFPSPDASEFPFGGVFLHKGKVVFYRYHIAKKFDFLGRDALYCVLGVMTVDDAAKTNPAKVFSLPEFVSPMRPFPASAEVPESDEVDVHEWLRNLDIMSLDVRISGTIDNMKFDVSQAEVVSPEPKQSVEPKSGVDLQSEKESESDEVIVSSEDEKGNQDNKIYVKVGCADDFQEATEPSANGSGKLGLFKKIIYFASCAILVLVSLSAIILALKYTSASEKAQEESPKTLPIQKTK